MLYSGDVVVSFSLPYLSVPPSLSSFAPSDDTAAAAADVEDDDVEPSSQPSQPSASSTAADAMTQVMSQIVAQMAAGQIVSAAVLSLFTMLVRVMGMFQ